MVGLQLQSTVTDLSRGDLSKNRADSRENRGQSRDIYKLKRMETAMALI